MSLSSHLRNRHSQVRHFLEHITDRRAVSRLVTTVNDKARLAAQGHGGIVHVPGTVATLAGAAFDYGFRAWMQPFVPGETVLVAHYGAAQAVQLGWRSAPALVETIIDSLAAADRLGQAQRFVALAVFERFYREHIALPTETPQGSTGDTFTPSLLRNPPRTLDALLARLPTATVEDVAALLEASEKHWAWMRGRPFVPNPTFALSAGVGGADADWVIDGVLYECKVSYQNRPVEGMHLRQLLGYLLLDSDDALKLEGVGLFLPRQREHILWTVPSFFHNLGIAGDLATVRDRFAAMVAALRENTLTRERIVVIDPETSKQWERIRVRSGQVPQRSDPSS